MLSGSWDKQLIDVATGPGQIGTRMKLVALSTESTDCRARAISAN